MRMQKLIAALALTAVLAPASVLAGEASGPAKGSSPMLTIQPANADGDPYCLTCQAGRNPAVVAFLTSNDEATHALLAQLAEQAEANKGKHLRVTAIIVANDEVSAALVKHAEDEQLAIPVAVVAPSNEGLKPWKLNAEVANTVVFLNQHKVHHSVADLASDDLAEHVGSLVGSGHGGGGHAGH